MSHGPRPPKGIRTIGDLPVGATRVLLVRHGQAAANVEGKFGGLTGCDGLSDLGRDQVTKLARRWSRSGEVDDATILVSSDLRRAIETADLLSAALPSARRIAPRPGVAELHPGDADGLTWAQYAERFSGVDWDVDPTVPIAPSGESWATFTQRAVAAIDALAQEFAGQTIVVATHAGVVESSMLHHCFGGPAGRRLGLRTDHASVTEWLITADQWFLVRYNQTAVALEG